MRSPSNRGATSVGMGRALRHVALVVPVALALFTAGACNSKPKRKIPPESKEIFDTRCMNCHGQYGRGDGPQAQSLNPKPRNYSDGAWQKSVTDDHLREIIVKGGEAVGKSKN